MKKKIIKPLAVLGTILVWLPILAPLLFSLFPLIKDGKFMFDYLMPAELFPLILAGGLILLIFSWKLKIMKKWIFSGFITAVLALAGGQGLAEITGLASGAVEPEGFPFYLVLGSLMIFWLGIITLGIGGIKLVKQTSGK